ncbi:hypothetical protein [Nocardia callitridis]
MRQRSKFYPSRLNPRKIDPSDSSPVDLDRGQHVHGEVTTGERGHDEVHP